MKGRSEVNEYPHFCLNLSWYNPSVLTTVVYILLATMLYHTVRQRAVTD